MKFEEKLDSCVGYAFWDNETEYTRTPLYGHPLNTDTSLLLTVFFAPKESPYIFSKFNPLNTDTH